MKRWAVASSIALAVHGGAVTTEEVKSPDIPPQVREDIWSETRETEAGGTEHLAAGWATSGTLLATDKGSCPLTTGLGDKPVLLLGGLVVDAAPGSSVYVPVADDACDAFDVDLWARAAEHVQVYIQSEVQEPVCLGQWCTLLTATRHWERYDVEERPRAVCLEGLCAFVKEGE